ncbi:monovalent cation/H+ antiporter complex subunit F [Corynebacterium uterequi]|uniref:Multisubunit Na+/H+ antiporter, MnhF subunit n=1 Tax=Corynebacterium uterequi TaxID=1072256 RepID=A0A0G3HF21_9CORY|nr:monovalent cation/H+ antiporter complex subunit F [Corynebacterium uterequi]AKK11899.1 multisubunit Na+/H+ antiporter, MnhF subunit [Corynebacterium uterequi]
MPDHIYNLLLLLPGSLIAVALVLVLGRIVAGPDSMDRMIGLDGFIAIAQCTFAVIICWTLDTTAVNAMLVVALLGFISTVSVARFRKRDDAK